MQRFRYLDLDVDQAAGVLRCRYALDDLVFEERIAVDVPGATWTPAAEEAARLVHLLAGVSYYKAAAPPVVDLGATPVRPGERAFLRDYHVHGLGEYAHRNGLDLTGIEVVGGAAGGEPAAYDPAPGRPLIPFGGGIDSIVVVEEVARRPDVDAALFVASGRGGRFAPIEEAAAVTGLPVLRAERELDPKVLRSAELGYRNGHVPVTAILSAIAVLVAVLDGRDAVIMSNERSASVGNLVVDGREVNHQWSKGAAYEAAFREVLAGRLQVPPQWFSLLRDRSELWVAERMAALPQYHPVFRSCNRAFAIDPAARWDTWCGECDKCCFIDLVLAPFMPADALRAVFRGREPLDDPALLPRFEPLVGIGEDVKPWECVGDEDECRAAVALASARPDRSGNAVLASLAARMGPAPDAAAVLEPGGPTSVPARYAVGA